MGRLPEKGVCMEAEWVCDGERRRVPVRRDGSRVIVGPFRGPESKDFHLAKIRLLCSTMPVIASRIDFPAAAGIKRG